MPRRLNVDGDRPCVWMLAGLLSYRLCDRDYDCEACPLDAALLGRAAGPARLEPTLPRCWEFPEDRDYAPDHGWVQQRGEGRLRCGIDAFAAQCLTHTRGWILPALGSLVGRGGSGGWCVHEGGLPVPLRCAAEGRVVAVNELLFDEPVHATRDPYGRGWLFELRGRVTGGLWSARRARRASEAALATLRRRFSRALERPGGQVGCTAADGGRPLMDLHDILGPQRYRDLVAHALHN